MELFRIFTDLGVHFVQTSTGYGSGGATLEDVRLMKEHVGPDVQVKAAGGIRTLDALLAMRDAGASRIGASRTAQILDALRERLLRESAP